MDRIEPAEPMDRIDPLEPMDRIDPLEPMLNSDPVEPCCGRAETGKRMGSFSQPHPLMALGHRSS